MQDQFMSYLTGVTDEGQKTLKSMTRGKNIPTEGWMRLASRLDHALEVETKRMIAAYDKKLNKGLSQDAVIFIQMIAEEFPLIDPLTAREVVLTKHRRFFELNYKAEPEDGIEDVDDLFTRICELSREALKEHEEQKAQPAE